MQGQVVNILGFEDHSVYVTTIQIPNYSTKAAVNIMYSNEYGCVPVEHYLGTLTFEFYVILECHEKFFLEDFSTI